MKQIVEDAKHMVLLEETKPKKGYEDIVQINNIMGKRLLKLNIFAYLIWTSILCFLYININSKNKSITPYLIGWLFTSYLLFYHYISEKRVILKINDHKKEIKEIKNEIESDKTIIKTVPLIIFALGVILKERFKTINTNNITNYFILCIVFGVIIPFIIDTLIIDYDNIKRLLLFENLEFINISYAFGILLIVLLNIIMEQNY